MTTHYIKLWHRSLDSVETTLNSLKKLPFGIGKKVPNLRQMLTIEGSPTKAMLDKELVAGLFLDQFGIQMSVERKNENAPVLPLR
jgi:hypothetical protein